MKSITACLFLSVLADGQQMVSVASFGADPTGVKDSLPAARQAAQSLVASGGGTVCFPSGQYKFDSYITARSGDNYNLLTYTDNTTFAPCSGAVPGSVAIFQGPNGWGTALHPAFGPIAVFNTSFFLSSSVGQNGYQNRTQNGGYYTLQSPLAAGAMSATFANPIQAANCPAGEWIAISTSNQQTGAISPLEINQVLSSNSSTGAVTLRWPQTVGYPTYSGNGSGVFAACVSPMVRQNVKITGLTLRTSAGILLNDLYNVEFDGNHIQCDSTYVSRCRFFFSNGVRHLVAQNNILDHYPSSSGSFPKVDWANNNPIDLYISGNTMDTGSSAGSEYAEHAIFSQNKVRGGGVFSGFDIHVESNDFTAVVSQMYGQVSDNSTGPNPYLFPFQGTKFIGNRISGIGGGGGLNATLILYQPDTQVISNTISTALNEIAIATQCCRTGIAPQHTIVGNDIHCDAYTGPYGCIIIQGSAVDGDLISGNNLVGTNGSTVGVAVQDYSSSSTGVIIITGNSQTGFSTVGPKINLSKHMCPVINSLQVNSCAPLVNILSKIPIAANNAAAVAAGVPMWGLYRSGGNPDVVSVVH